jgi:hypothetical protein
MIESIAKPWSTRWAGPPKHGPLVKLGLFADRLSAAT